MYHRHHMINLRKLARKLKILRFIAELLNRGADYEARFKNGLMDNIKSDWCVWDVGANVGIYTEYFRDAVPQGSVVAFEPDQSCVGLLQDKFKKSNNVTIEKYALSDRDNEVLFSSDEFSVTNGILTNDDNESLKGTKIQAVTGETYVSSRPERFPNAIKVDVEGHEYAVFSGIESMLSDRRLCLIGIEVHFSQLSNNGNGHFPEELHRKLMDHGFRVKWLDSSHILASRKR